MRVKLWNVNEKKVVDVWCCGVVVLWCVGVGVGVVCGCVGVGVGVCGCVGIYMSLYCMLDGVRQGRRDI